VSQDRSLSSPVFPPLLPCWLLMLVEPAVASTRAQGALRWDLSSPCEVPALDKGRCLSYFTRSVCAREMIIKLL